MKFKNQFFVVLTFCTMLLSGCGSLQSKTRNLTSQNVAQNLSNRYRISVYFDTRDGRIIRDSIKPQIVIDGKVFTMNIDKENNDVFFYDYEISNGRTKAKYYFQIDYDYANGNAIRHKIFQSKLFEFNLINRYSIELECERGVVGSKVTIFGRGFNHDDEVLFGEEVCVAEVESPNTIRFIVPNITVGKLYQVKIVGDSDTINVGQFYVDGGKLSADLDTIEMTTDSTTIIVLSADSDALSEGIDLQLSTSIPESIKIKAFTRILPTSRNVSVVVNSTAIGGEGTISAHADGFNDVTIPVSVLGKGSEVTGKPVENSDVSKQKKNFTDSKQDSIFVE